MYCMCTVCMHTVHTCVPCNYKLHVYMYIYIIFNFAQTSVPGPSCADLHVCDISHFAIFKKKRQAGTLANQKQVKGTM